MKSLLLKLQQKVLAMMKAGFVLPFTMLITVLVLFIVTSSMTLLSKQIYFSKLYRQNQAAYYAADDAISCTTAIDDTYVAADGLGIFPSNPLFDVAGAQTYIDSVLTYVQTKSGGPVLSRSDIRCGQSTMLDSAAEFTVYPLKYKYYFINPVTGLKDVEEGKTVSFKMRMNLGDGTYRCATVTVNKTPSFRQIIAQGYSSCDTQNGAVERAVVNTTVAE